MLNELKFIIDIKHIGLHLNTKSGFKALITIVEL